MTGQTFALCRAFSPFGGNRSSDKPKGGSAPSTCILHVQCELMSVLFLRTQVVPVLAVGTLLIAWKLPLLQSSLEVEGGFTVRIDLCYYCHNSYVEKPPESEALANRSGGSLYHYSQAAGTPKTIACISVLHCTRAFCK